MGPRKDRDNWYDENDRRENGVTWYSPFGKFQIRGINVLLTTVLIVLVVGTTLLYFHSQADKEMQDGFKAILMEIAKQQQQMNDRENEMNYILTLKPEERQNLKLVMPDSLRRRMREGDNP